MIISQIVVFFSLLMWGHSTVTVMMITQNFYVLCQENVTKERERQNQLIGQR